MKRAALIFAALAAILTAAAAPVRTATENFVSNKIAEAVAAIPAPDYSTNNAALVETIQAKAPAPGNYAAVSNAAMSAAMADDVYTKAEMNAELNGLQREIAHYGQIAENAVSSVNGKTGNAVTLDAKDIDILMIRGNTTTNIEHAVNGLDIEMGITFDAVFGRFEETQEKLPYPTNAIPYAAISGKPTNVSAFENDAGYLTGYTESDPTVPQWAKAQTKPTYTASEVGAYSTGDVDIILRDYLPLDYFRDGQTIPMYWGDGTKLCDFGANWLGNLAAGVQNNSDAIDAISDDIPSAVSNIVTTALVRERLGVYLYVGADGGIYVHTNED